MEQPILQVEHLTKHFPAGRRSVVHAVDDVSFTLRKGRTFGLVGESGCGKSSCARTIIRIYDPTSGKIILDGQDITKLSARQLQPIRRKMQMIFQDPYASLNARMTVRDIIAEPLIAHHVVKNKKEVDDYVYPMLERVGLTREHAGRYAHEFSGGQRQRVGIARALVLKPELVICDEPISALDVSIQAQVVNLLRDYQQEEGLSYLSSPTTCPWCAMSRTTWASCTWASWWKPARRRRSTKIPFTPTPGAFCPASPWPTPRWPAPGRTPAWPVTCPARSTRPRAAASTPAAPTPNPSAPSRCPR